LATAKRLIELGIPSVRGNEDRIILHPPKGAVTAFSLEYVLGIVTTQILDWLRALPAASVIQNELLLCHGTPQSDENYLLEEVSPCGVSLKTSERLMEELALIEQPVVLCGHSHIPKVNRLPDGKLVVNAGSVGLPAYEDDAPFPHKMETGSPHAKYVILSKDSGRWSAEPVAVPYEWENAVAAATENGRPDWARWLASGRA
jgi:diadenosine tetraphosphatase ApaH/serine/threonine PP2A family protein phosphatase